MPINITTDTSTQLTYSSFGYAITTNDNFATSNYANTLSTNNTNYTRNDSNILKANIRCQSAVVVTLENNTCFEKAT